MHIHITTDGVTVTDLEELRALDAVIEPGVDADSILRSTHAGHVVDDDHIAVTLAFLRASALGANLPAGWEAGFEKTVAYAESKGWVLQDPPALRVHVVQNETLPPSA
ncbi:hypothetical protein [Microbacterium lushaniae]|uniref:Uncharacterized protein n=1 Tax=Microbacterium lushaniae TaxID=2614639 RepID=A0A5J6L442_9MICO|nr:hypothetical protein [Microbacterium lushaniae]QEW03294.1 hypothetical protein F6J85_09385 [Microbacterium lushaniae]